MDDQELKVVEAMRTYGGSFVKALGDCFCHADPMNFQRLKSTFSGYWKQYEKMAKKNGKTNAGI